MAVAYAISDLSGEHLALGAKVTANLPEPLCWAGTTKVSRTDTRTAAVNLLQGCAESGQKVGSEIFVTYHPSPACIGMATMLGIKAIYFTDAGILKKLDLRNGAPPRENATNVDLAPPKGPDQINPPVPDVTDAGPGGWLRDLTMAGRRRSAMAWAERVLEPAERTNAKQHLKILAGYVDRAVAVTGVAYEREFAVGVPTSVVGGVRDIFRDRLFMALARVLVSRHWQPKVSGEVNPDLRQAFKDHPVAPGKNIGAVLVSASNQIIGWGVNTNDRNSTRHAETNAIQAFQREMGTPVPEGATLYTTLEPCYMCAGVFVQAGGRACVYEQTDPDMVDNTALYTTQGASLRKHVEVYTGKVDVVKKVPIIRVDTVKTIGKRLDEGLVTFRKNAGIGVRATAADYLRGGNAAYEVYSRAHERLAVTGMAARGYAEQKLWEQVLAFLRHGHSGRVALQPHLMMID